MVLFLPQEAMPAAGYAYVFIGYGKIKTWNKKNAVDLLEF
jgi:hypothetical protein